MSEAIDASVVASRSAQGVAEGLARYATDTALAGSGDNFVRLGDHVAIAKGKPPALIPYDGTGAAIYLSPEYLRGKSAGVMAKAGANAVLVDDGDVVLLWDGSNAGEFFRGRSGIAASTMARLIPSYDFESSYFVHALKHLEPVLKSKTHGTGIPHVDREVLEFCRVFRPEVERQLVIARVLDTLDTTIRKTEAIIAKLKQVKQGLLHDLLTRGIDANGELRPPQREAPHLYKQSPLGWVPKEWQCKTVKSAIDGSPRNGIYKPPGDIGSGVLLVGQTAFTPEGSVDFSLARRARVSKAECEAFGLRESDLLVSRVFATREGVGQPVIVPETIEPAVYESNMMRLRVTEQVIDPYLLFMWLKHSRARVWIMSRAFASNQASINREMICSMPIPLPSKDEQVTILAIARAHDSRLRGEMLGLSKAQKLKFGLMDDLLTGRVRVTPLLADTVAL